MLSFIHHKYLLCCQNCVWEWWWCLENICLYASSCSHAGNDPGTTN